MKTRYKSTSSHRPSNPRFVRQPTVLCEWNPVSPATLWRQIQAGKFPKPLKLSIGVTAWRLTDLEAWASDPAGFALPPRAVGK